MSESITDILYLERHRRRLTMKQVAERVGCTGSYIHELESGGSKPKPSKILEKLAELYNLDYAMVCAKMDESRRAVKKSGDNTLGVER